jgi:tRNA1Val (adenine37-N6)-methyltransferase
MQEGEYREVLNERLTMTMRRGAPVTTVDALLLAAFLPKDCGEACELGAGSGVISLLAAARGKLSSALLIEREEALYNLCRRNVRDNRFEALLTARHADLRDCEERAAFDTVFANPPYRRANDGMPAADPIADAARYERHGTIEDFCQTGARMLTEGGRFLVVFPKRRRDELLTAIASAGLSPEREVSVYPYPGGTPKLMLLSARRGACAHRHESFTLCREPGGMQTAAAERLYQDGILITEGETV